MASEPWDSALVDRARGCLLGLAIGDALGTTLEFSPRDSNPHHTEMTGGGPFGLWPMRTSSQIGPELSMQITASAPSAEAAGLPAVAIRRRTALGSVRFQAATACPASAMRRAMWAP